MMEIFRKKYKWWFLIWFHFKSKFAYRGGSMIWALGSFFGLIGSVLVWYVAHITGSEVNFNEIVTYLVFGNFFVLVTNSWVDVDLSNDIKNGALTTYLMYPTNIVQRYMAHYIGKAFLAEAMNYGISSLLVLPFFWSFVVWPSSIWHIIGYLILMPISYCVKFFTEFLIGSTAFWLVDISGSFAVKNSIYNFLRGGLIPLFILIPFAPWLIYNPFAWMGHHAMMTFLGDYTLKDYLLFYIIGVGWCILLMILSANVFKLGLKKNESVGL